MPNKPLTPNMLHDDTERQFRDLPLKFDGKFVTKTVIDYPPDGAPTYIELVTEDEIV